MGAWSYHIAIHCRAFGIAALAVNISETVSRRLNSCRHNAPIFWVLLPLRVGALASSSKACDIQGHHTSTSSIIIRAMSSISIDMFMMLNMDMGTSRSLLVWFMEWREVEHYCLLYCETIDSIPLGLAYIAIFGAGSIGGMTAISTLIGIPFVKLANSAKVSLLLRYVAQ